MEWGGGRSDRQLARRVRPRRQIDRADLQPPADDLRDNPTQTRRLKDLRPLLDRWTAAMGDLREVGKEAAPNLQRMTDDLLAGLSGFWRRRSACATAGPRHPPGGGGDGHRRRRTDVLSGNRARAPVAPATARCRRALRQRFAHRARSHSRCPAERALLRLVSDTLP